MDQWAHRCQAPSIRTGCCGAVTQWCLTGGQVIEVKGFLGGGARGSEDPSGALAVIATCIELREDLSLCEGGPCMSQLSTPSPGEFKCLQLPSSLHTLLKSRGHWAQSRACLPCSSLRPTGNNVSTCLLCPTWHRRPGPHSQTEHIPPVHPQCMGPALVSPEHLDY